MPFYLLSICSLGGVITLRLLGKNRQFQSYLLVAATAFLFAGLLQGSDSPQMAWFRYALMLFRVLFGLISPFAFLFFGLALVFNGGLLLKKEGWAKRYGLLFAVGAFILLMDLLFLLNYFVFHHYLIWRFMRLMGYFIIYFGVVLILFFIATAFYGLIPVAFDKDFIIVLGAGLLPDGGISPLLQQRLDRAIRFFRQQTKRTQKRPCRLIVSGGQGVDEPFSEAFAMKRYLIEKGIPEELILEEDASVNTYQNLLYSKGIMDTYKENYKCLFITNNFHVVRSSLYAHRVGLETDGLGAWTPIYFLPYAFLREFIALVFLQIKGHALLLALVLAAGVWRIYF